MRRQVLIASLFGLLAAMPTPLRAEITRFVELEGFGKLLEGDPKSVALTEDGGISLRPAAKERFSDPGLTFGAAGTWGDDIVLARLGAEPALIAVDPRGKNRPLIQLGQQFVTAIVETPGNLVVAASEGGKAKLFLMPNAAARKAGLGAALATLKTIDIDARFVWDLVVEPSGSLLLVTGEPGTVVRVDGRGQAQTIWRAEEAHLKSICLDTKLGLVVGGGERGIVYHAASAKGAKVPLRAIYDTGNHEVTKLLVDGESIFVASVAGNGQPVAGGEAGARPTGKPTEVRSTLVKLSLEGSAEMLAASTDELLFDLALDAQHRLLVATGALGKGEPRGRLYRVETSRKQVSLLYQTPAKRIVRLLPDREGTVLVEQEGTRLVTLGKGAASEGVYLSASIDTGVVSRFGLVQLLGDLPKGSAATLSARTGQTSEPDGSWSEFAEAVAAPGNVAVKVPNGRYVQLRLTLRGRNEAQPIIYKARLAYLRQNLRPFIQDVFVLPRGQALYPMPQGLQNEDAGGRVVVLAGKGDEGAARESGALRRPPPRARQVSEPGAVTVRWLVDEPNGDDLEYTLSVRAAGESDYQVVARQTTEPFHTFHSAQLADGWYFFRVEASDVRSNAQELAKSDSRESRAVLIDNAPPSFAKVHALLEHGRVTIVGQISDKLSPLVVLEAAIDGGPLRPVAPVDGLLDGLREEFRFALPNDLAPGSHTVALRARDEADNTGHAFVRFQIPTR